MPILSSQAACARTAASWAVGLRWWEAWRAAQVVGHLDEEGLGLEALEVGGRLGLTGRDELGHLVGRRGVLPLLVGELLECGGVLHGGDRAQQDSHLCRRCEVLAPRCLIAGEEELVELRVLAGDLEAGVLVEVGGDGPVARARVLPADRTARGDRRDAQRREHQPQGDARAPTGRGAGAPRRQAAQPDWSRMNASSYLFSVGLQPSIVLTIALQAEGVAVPK